MALLFIFTLDAPGQVKTNKDKLLTIAVQGRVTPTKVATSYTTTWDGRYKLAIGMGGIILENVDYDIQTTCPETVEEHDLKTLRLGDLVAIQDH